MGFLVICGVIAVAGLPSLDAQLAFLLLAVAVGLPHGALDGRDGKRLFAPKYGRWWFMPFLAGYGTLFAITLLSWWLAPTFALFTFLAISLVHFGQCDRDPMSRFPWGSVLAHGSIPIVLPTLAFPDDVQRLFAWLAGEREAVIVLAVLTGPVAVIWLASVCVEIAQAFLAPRRSPHPDGRFRSLATGGSLVVLFATVPPILAFSLYFALFHAPRALLQTISQGDSMSLAAIGHTLRQAVPLSLAALAIGVGLFLFQSIGDWSSATVRSVFLLLSALTVPHMWLKQRLYGVAGAKPTSRIHSDLRSID